MVEPETAYCDQCGWEGMQDDLKGNTDYPMDEFCPECWSSNTWWGTPDE